MPIHSCGQSVSARRGKPFTEIGLFNSQRTPCQVREEETVRRSRLDKHGKGMRKLRKGIMQAKRQRAGKQAGPAAAASRTPNRPLHSAAQPAAAHSSTISRTAVPYMTKYLRIYSQMPLTSRASLMFIWYRRLFSGVPTSGESQGVWPQTLGGGGGGLRAAHRSMT